MTRKKLTSNEKKILSSLEGIEIVTPFKAETNFDTSVRVCRPLLRASNLEGQTLEIYFRTNMSGDLLNKTSKQYQEECQDYLSQFIGTELFFDYQAKEYHYSVPPINWMQERRDCTDNRRFLYNANAERISKIIQLSGFPIKLLEDKDYDFTTVEWNRKKEKAQ